MQNEYKYLQEHCDEMTKEETIDTDLCLDTQNVEISMDLVYTLYQYFSVIRDGYGMKRGQE